VATQPNKFMRLNGFVLSAKKNLVAGVKTSPLSYTQLWFHRRAVMRSLAVVWLGGLSVAFAHANPAPSPSSSYIQTSVSEHAQPVNSPFQSSLNLPGSLADLVERISPAVVNIKVTTESGETTTLGQGSGFIISTKGEVVTNYHVIEGGDNIAIEFNNGESLPARVLGTDAETDLALLQIEHKRSFPRVPFYHGKKIRIGDYVIAIGNPFGIGQSTSLGIISAIGRDTVDSGSYVDYIQTDATINTGNSGGPLFNPKGEVVGVNSAIYSPTGASVGIAFAIPHYTAEDIIEALRRDGRVRRGWLGAGLRTAQYTLENDPGIYRAGATIHSLFPGGPAEQHGLKVDDIILNINGQAVLNSVEATRIIGRSKPGDRIKFIIERDEVSQNISVAISERPEKDVVEKSVSIATTPAPAPSSGDTSASGLSLVDLSSTFRDSIGMRPDQVGVYVESVLPGSPAAQKGLKSGMVLLEADHEPIASVRKFRSLLMKAKRSGQSAMTLKVRLGNGGESYVSLPFIS